MNYLVYYLDLESSEYDTFVVEANDAFQAKERFDSNVRDPFMVDIRVICSVEEGLNAILRNKR